MSLVKEGWIEKKGQTFMAGYKKRWLVLYSDKTLKYYEDKYYEILKGSVDISEATKVQYGRQNSKNWKFGWEIVTPTRIWHFSSKSDHDRKQWIQCIQTAMEHVPALHEKSRTLSYLNKALKNIAKELDTNKSSDDRKTANYNNIDEEDIDDEEQEEVDEQDENAFDHDDDDEDDDEDEDDGYHPMETGEYGRNTIPMMTEYDFDGGRDFFGTDDDDETEHVQPEPEPEPLQDAEKQIQVQIEKKDEGFSTNPFKRKGTNPFEENTMTVTAATTSIHELKPATDFDAAAGDTNGRTGVTTDEETQKKPKKGGLFSSAFGKKNKSVVVAQTVVNSAKSQIEQSSKQRTSKFGKRTNRTNMSKTTQMMNKQINLSWHHHQEHRDDTKSDPAEEYHKRFSWRMYERKIRELSKKNEQNKHQFESQYELKCFCGARLCKTKCVQESQRMICEFCGIHTLSAGAIYFECEDSHNENNALHEDYEAGWKVCSMCAYDELLTKYYNPKLHGHKPRAVGMNVMVQRVSDIDTANQSFRAKITIKHSWKPSKEEVDLFKQKPAEFEPFWTPQFEFANCIEIHAQGFKSTHWRKRYIILRRGESNGDHLCALPYIISGEYWIDATFSELFELGHFPVDCQDLTIKLLCKQYTQIAEFRTPLQGANLLSVYKDYAAISEWKIREPKFEIITKKNIGGITAHSMLNLSIKLQRIYKPYFWRMILILMLLCAASLLSFTMDILENHGVHRIAYLATLLLIAIVYQYNIKHDLPKVWYLTLMDKYILCSFLFMFVILLQTTVLAKLSWDEPQFFHLKDALVELIDSYCHYGFWAVFVCFHIVFVIVTLRAKQYEKHKLRCLPSDVDKYTHKRRISSKLHKVHKFKLHSSESTHRKCLW